MNGINEVGQALIKEAEIPFGIKLKEELDRLNAQWDNICKQVRAERYILLYDVLYGTFRFSLFL